RIDGRALPDDGHDAGGLRDRPREGIRDAGAAVPYTRARLGTRDRQDGALSRAHDTGILHDRALHDRVLRLADSRFVRAVLAADAAVRAADAGHWPVDLHTGEHARRGHADGHWHDLACSVPLGLRLSR